jgi:hypothetical protein
MTYYPFDAEKPYSDEMLADPVKRGFYPRNDRAPAWVSFAAAGRRRTTRTGTKGGAGSRPVRQSAGHNIVAPTQGISKMTDDEPQNGC